MANDDRNFRSAYYEKVGFKSVEEKRSLEILLKDKQLDVLKLRQFCLRFAVPSAHKNVVWKLVLGISPALQSAHSFVSEQQKKICSNLLRALTDMKYNRPDVPKPQVFIYMYILQTGKLIYHWHDKSVTKYMFPIVETGILDMVQNYQHEIPMLVEAACNLLKSEDKNLHKHLVKISALDSLPWDSWLKSCFAGTLDNVALGKIWDKLCAGSYKILIYTAVLLLISLKLKLLKCETSDEVLAQIAPISEDVAEVIATKSIELWQQQGSPLSLH